MTNKPLVSIIINNYNYGRFLKETIDSALNQTYDNTEVIVVDDGSTDNSHKIIVEYGNRIRPTFKDNGGQNSALNAAYSLINGEVIFFLDADDTYSPTTVMKVMQKFSQSKIVCVQWPLWAVNSSGHKLGSLIPRHILSEGNLRESVIQNGPDGLNYSYASGMAYTRKFLSDIFPLPDINIEGSGMFDAYLSMFASLFGSIAKVDEPLGSYRLHGANLSWKNFEKKHLRNLKLYEHRVHALAQYCEKMDINAKPSIWLENSWHHILEKAIEKIVDISKEGDMVILVDDNQWGVGENLRGRICLPFLEKDGQYWGPPQDDKIAIKEFNRLQTSGANYFVFAWPSFWWLEHYKELYQYLRTNFTCILENDRLVVFDLRNSL